MEKKLLFASCFWILSSLANANASDIHLDFKWNLKGTSQKIEVEDSYLNNPEVVKIVWVYRDKMWYAWSPDIRIKSLLEHFNIDELQEIKPFEGFWVYSIADADIPSIKKPDLSKEGVLKRALEGRYSEVLSTLSNKRTTDEEKIAYAIALLQKSIDNVVLKNMGIVFIPGYNKFFSIEDHNSKDWYNSEEWVSSANNLLSAIDSSLKELSSVSNDVKIQLPSFATDGEDIIIDEASVKFIMALLKLKKSLLQYALGYNWQGVANLGKSSVDKALLPYLESLNPVNNYLEYFNEAKKSFIESLDLLDEASQIASSYDEETFKKSLIYYLVKDDEEDLSTTDVLNFKKITLANVKESLNGVSSVSNPNYSYAERINLKYFFETPFNGNKLKNDVESKKVLEMEVCEGGYEYCWDSDNNECQKICYDYTNEVWFTKDSYYFKFISSIVPSIDPIYLHKRKLDGKTYYTLDKNIFWDFVPPRIVK